MRKDYVMTKQMAELDVITEKIIGCSYTVSNTLGSGFSEKVYENALAHELRKSGLAVQQQHSIQVMYDGAVVGDYVVDLIVARRVLVELKAVDELNRFHMGVHSHSMISLN